MPRGKGQGCIRQRSVGSWQLLYYVDGVKKSLTIKGTKRDAERKMTELQRSIDQGSYKAPSKQTVGQFLNEWLDRTGHTIGVRTRGRYESIIKRYLLPAFGDCPLTNLKVVDIERVYIEWAKGGLSPSTIHLHHAVLHKALEAAVKWEMIQRNPSDQADLPAKVRQEREPLDDDDLRRLLEEAKETPHYPVVVLAVTTGMRVGEICGLKWSDIDFGNKLVTIQRTAARIGGEVILKEPKTKRARRCVDIPDEVVEALRGLSLSGANFIQGLVFPRRNGLPTDPHTMTKTLKRVFGVGVHDLRHAHASFLMRQNIHPRIVSDRLGHSSIAFTLDVYSHLTGGQQRIAADAAGSLVLGSSDNIVTQAVELALGRGNPA
jgi:integrase